MTGASWGEYQDYLYGRFDGINHEDEAQTDREGRKIGHGGDVYYMCPGTNYGKFLCVGVQRALDAGAEAIHLEEPEYWDRAGYSGGFKREWAAYYQEPWQPPHSSVDARWRTGKLKYFLYRRALQQVFDYVQAYNQRTGRHVRCYVPTHSLLNYAQWCIVSPESSLAQLSGCDGYIAQVWTGTSREPNRYQGEVRSRTFETAFLEYGAMQNLVRATGRSVWYENDPIEDNPNHDWTDYRSNWESTLTASLFQPEISKFEVAPWPERIFGGRYPRSARGEDRKPIPPAYATELQTIFNALNDLKQTNVAWDCGTAGIGVVISDSLMFQRGQPTPSDPHLGNVYGLAMPLLEHGLPVTPRPARERRHPPLPRWILRLALELRRPKTIVSRRSHPSGRVGAPRRRARRVRQRRRSLPQRPRLVEHQRKSLRHPAPASLRATRPRRCRCDQSIPSRRAGRLALAAPAPRGILLQQRGRGPGSWPSPNPPPATPASPGARPIISSSAAAPTSSPPAWTNPSPTNRAGSPATSSTSSTPNCASSPASPSSPHSRWFLLDLDLARTGQTRLLASACKALPKPSAPNQINFTVEGISDTPAILLLESPQPPKTVTLAGKALNYEYSADERLLRIHFPNESTPRDLAVHF